MTVPSSSLLRSLDLIGGRHVWVVGDVMLDEYVTGAVERISPEAPIPVLQVRGSEHRLGGAANVARQLVVLGHRVTLGAVVGADETGQELAALARRSDVDTRALVVASGRRTTRKVRALSQGQQLLRLDFEDTTPADEVTTSQLVERLEGSAAPDIIVLSDYAKGVVTESLMKKLVRLGHSANCPIVVDPKRANLGAYAGAHILTPNLAELRQASHDFDAGDLNVVASVAREIAERHAFQALVVTLGERGVLLVPSDGAQEHIPADLRAVFDVTGAGDTVVAILAAGLAAGVPLRSSALLANIAAGIAVGEVGTTAVTREQIRAALAAPSSLKILDRAELTTRVASWRLAGRRIAFTNGCFDLLHAGHLSLLQAAAQHGDVLVLAINSDESVRRLKGPSRPVVPAAERAALLAALEYVDAVTIFPEDTPLATIEIVRPHALIKGADYRVGDVVGRELVEHDGGKVVLVPLYGSRSTTDLMERIRKTSG